MVKKMVPNTTTGITTGVNLINSLKACNSKYTDDNEKNGEKIWWEEKDVVPSRPKMKNGTMFG